MPEIKPPPLYLRDWREAKGLRGVDLARALDIRPQQLAQWESGFRYPSRMAQAQIAAAMGVDYLDLYRLPKAKDRK